MRPNLKPLSLTTPGMGLSGEQTGRGQAGPGPGSAGCHGLLNLSSSLPRPPKRQVATALLSQHPPPLSPCISHRLAMPQS